MLRADGATQIVSTAAAGQRRADRRPVLRGHPPCFSLTCLTRRPAAQLNQPVLISVVTDELLAALADPLRVRIVELLAGEQLCTCHLVELTGARQTNISNHLRVLRAAGLVEPRPAGRYTFYQLRSEALAELAGHYGDLAARARDAAQIRRPCT